jgi:hypothetical protein
MTDWTPEELTTIAAEDELRLTSRRRDGSLRNPVTIWAVRHGDDVYVRSVYGDSSAWYRGTQVAHEGRVESGGVSKEVSFEPGVPELNDTLDTAYRTKYRRYATSIVESCTTPAARSTTIRLVPQ